MEYFKKLLNKRFKYHSLIVRGKKENLKISFFAIGTSNLKAWLPWAWLPYAATEKSVRSWESLYIKDSLAVFLLVARVSQLSSCSISVTLA